MRLVIVIVAVLFGFTGPIQAYPLPIYEIQYTTDVNGISPQNGQIIDCLGGIVTHKPPTGRPRLIIQDSNYPNGWGAIQVKDLYSTGVFEDVNVGDWVSFTNVLVEDNKGTTFLQYIEDNNAGFAIVSSNNALPAPKVVIIDEIAAPIEGIDRWAVSNHKAEKYEGMLIKVVNVSVKDTGYGKAYDNYILASNNDPNSVCWATDYINADRGGIYHPFIEVGNTFCGVTGFLEQYTIDESEGIYYDYYQLLTTKTDDFLILQPADLDGDCDVDFEDLGIFMGYWMQTDCAEPDNCGGANMAPEQPDGVVNILDLIEFIQYLLEEKS